MLPAQWHQATPDQFDATLAVPLTGRCILVVVPALIAPAFVSSTFAMPPSTAAAAVLPMPVVTVMFHCRVHLHLHLRPLPQSLTCHAHVLLVMATATAGASGVVECDG